MNETNSNADNGLQVFNNPKFGVLRTKKEADKTYFSLVDVCDALALSNSRKTKLYLSKDGVTTGYVIDKLGRMQQSTFIDEKNLYRCIFKSRKKEAIEFQDWVFDEVLPSIRKRGGYIAEKKEDTPETIMARALQVANDVLAKREKRITQLEEENTLQQEALDRSDERLMLQDEELKKQAPKVSYYDSVLQSQDTLTMTQVAKSLGMEANTLAKKLKDARVLFRQSGSWMLHVPYSRWKLHSMRTQVYTRADGTTGSKSYMVWNERGRRFIIAMYNNGWNAKAAVKAINGEKGGAL